MRIEQTHTAPWYIKKYSTKMKRNICNIVKIKDFCVKVITAETNIKDTMNNQTEAALFNVKAVIKYKGKIIDIVEECCQLEQYGFLFPELAPDIITRDLNRALSRGFTYESLFGRQIFDHYMKSVVSHVYESEHRCSDPSRIEKEFEDLRCILVPKEEHFTLLFGENKHSIAVNNFGLSLF